MEYLFSTVIERLRAKVRDCDAARRHSESPQEVPMQIEGDDALALTTVHLSHPPQSPWPFRPSSLLHSLSSVVRALMRKIHTPELPMIEYYPSLRSATHVDRCLSTPEIATASSSTPSLRKRPRDFFHCGAASGSEETDGAARCEDGFFTRLIKGRRLDDGRSEYDASRIREAALQQLPDLNGPSRGRKRCRNDE